MQLIDRSDEPPPACLSDERAAPARDMLRAIFGEDETNISQRRVSMSKVVVIDDELDQALRRLFRERCAFCESKDSLTAYRFRPIEEAGPSDAAPQEDADRSHLYYTWLINAWQNLYAICPGCRPREASIFPVLGRRCRLPTGEQIELYVDKPVGMWRRAIAERPMFLDPCGNEDFRRNLAALPNGEHIGLSGRAEATIHHFSLNRPELVTRRSFAFRNYLQNLLANARAQSDTSDSFIFSNMEFGGGWFLLLYQLARKLGGGGGGRPTLSRKRIAQYYSERFERQDFAGRLEAAFDDLLDRPGQLMMKRAGPVVPVHGDARPVAFSISNFKALEQVEIALPVIATSPSFGSDASEMPRAASLVILGENAAGKSSILEALALALASQAARDDLSLDVGRLMLDPALMGCPPGTPVREGMVRVRFENGDATSMKVASGLPFSEGAELPRIPVFAYGAFRLFLKSDRRLRSSSPIRSLFEANYVLPNPEPWLASLAGKPLFSEVARALKAILAIDQDVDVIAVDPQTRECALCVRRSLGDGPDLEIRTPFSTVSSGFRAVLAMVCDVMRGLVAIQGQLSASLAKARAVVLIDEIEAHLHPKWKMRIIHGLREALPNVTFIMTTHDPLCLRGLGGDEVRVFRRVERPRDHAAEALPTHVEQLDEIPMMGALTIEQLLTSDLFQLHSTDAVDAEIGFARAGDLLAKQRAEDALLPADEDALQQVREMLRRQIGGAMPIGSTEVERLIQDAVEDFLVKRRTTPPKSLPQLRKDTRARIAAVLEAL